jgi:SET domain-containing protein
LSDKEAARYEDRGAKYLFVVNKRCTIDGSPRWNLARYINHSCRPNAEAVGRDGGIVFIASRRIEPDEEITIDYGREYYLYFVDNGGCQCVPCRAKAARRRRKLAAARKSRQSRSKPAAARKSRHSRRRKKA